MVVQARTLEFYGPYGFTGRVVEQGVVAETANVREGGSGGSLSISFKEMGPGLSPYPFALAYAPLDFTTRIFELLDQEPFVIALRIAVDQKTRIFHCQIARHLFRPLLIRMTRSGTATTRSVAASQRS
jgi:hypothetical protein